MEQKIYTNFSGKNFTQIRNQAVRDEKLSWKARGILTYLASLPSDWKIYKSEVMKHSTDKKDSFNSGWNELRKAGYICGFTDRQNGKFSGYTWIVTDDPSLLIPEADFPVSGNRESEKSASTNTNITNTDFINTIDASIDTDDILKSYNREFLTKKTIQIFLLFGSYSEAKKYLNIIFTSKIFVEKKLSTANSVVKIYGDIWGEEIEKTAIRFILKMKEANLKEKPITNLEAYWNKIMITFWENAYCMVRDVGFIEVEMLYSNNLLEMKDIFFELKQNFSSKKEMEEERKRFVYGHLK